MLPPDFLEQRREASKFKAWFIDTWYSICSWPLLVRTFGLWWITYDDFVCREIGIGSHEKDEIAFYKSYIKKGWVVFDVGAHAGLCSTIFSKLVGDAGLVVSFEPSKRELARLRRTLWLNRCKNVMLFPLALSDKEGDIPFYISIDENTGRNTITPDGDAYLSRVAVESTTLDDVMKAYAYLKNRDGSINFIKIDVEGAEGLVFNGGKETISKFHPDILFEEWGVYGKMWKDCQEIPTIKFLKDLGYRFYIVVGSNTFPLRDYSRINTNNLLASVRI